MLVARMLSQLSLPQIEERIVCLDVVRGAFSTFVMQSINFCIFYRDPTQMNNFDTIAPIGPGKFF
jgi:hypothetical protein